MKFQPLAFFRFPSYAQCPTPLVMEDRVRVYFSERDEKNRSHIRFCDLDLDDPTSLLCEGPRVMELGRPGTFDDEGQIPSCARRTANGIQLWYSGWNTRNTVPYHNAAGFVWSDNGGQKFRRLHDGPILDRTAEEPYLAVTPCFDDTTIYYVSGLRWESIGGRYEPIYLIHRCWVDLSRENMAVVRVPAANPVIPQAHPLECFSRPWVAIIDGRKYLFYAYRSALDYRDGAGAYRIGMAIMRDDKWLRDDVSLSLPRSEFDQTMQSYPAIFEAKGRVFMLYNGNSFGKHGFGVAVCD